MSIRLLLGSRHKKNKVSIPLILLFVLFIIIASILTNVYGSLVSDAFIVAPGSIVKKTIHISNGSYVEMRFSVFVSSGFSDIIFRALDPDGNEIFLRKKVYGDFSWNFTAYKSGNYVLEFDNTYSNSPKYIALAMSIEPPPKTITSFITFTTVLYSTHTETATIPVTSTTTIISPTTESVTYIKTVTSISTYTVISHTIHTEVIYESRKTTFIETITSVLFATRITEHFTKYFESISIPATTTLISTIIILLRSIEIFPEIIVMFIIVVAIVLFGVKYLMRRRVG